ncbi:MAG: PilZ domain-containing protein [Chloroflexi bacterium]|nr:PilZ domain-containing protein [Chloroflexota bacterium]
MADRLDTYSTCIEEITESGIAVLVPIRNLKVTPLPLGGVFRAVYSVDRQGYQFTTRVIGTAKACDVLSLPRRIDSTDRRNAYRLDTALQPSSVYRLVIDGENQESMLPLEGTLVDLSEGGLCLSTRQPVNAGERLGIEVALPEVGVLLARMRVISVDYPRYGYRNHQVHCMFLDLPRQGRDLIARYLMKRQLELRRLGQL